MDMAKLRRMKKRCRGQAIVEYIIIVVIVALAALAVLGIFSDTIRDCQLLQNLIQRDGCASRCPIMNTSSGLEYLCSCHPRNIRVSTEIAITSSAARWTTTITTLTTA